MSAIAGMFHLNETPISIEHSSTLMKSYEKYPADDTQTWQNQNLFFYCLNQWITPESIGERLPRYDYEHKLAITSDAIIDNREELFERLQIRKQDRNKITDSELILLSYKKWGEESPKYLVGDFVFLIWDENMRKLFGARDFSGSRTFYYYSDFNRFAFSTTIEPLLQLPFIKKGLNDMWMAEFLAIPNMVEAVDMNLTPYSGIFQLPPCHSISIIMDGTISIKKYQQVVPTEELRLKSNEEYEEAFSSVFHNAVSQRLRTRGNSGSHLSGGLDSGAVASFAATALKKANKKLHTYSYIPSNDFVDWTSNFYAADETPYIKETVSFVGNIEDHYMSFDGKSPLTELDEMLEIMEMPYKFFENSFWLKGIFQEASNEGIKVMLNGARGNHSISWGSWNLTMNYYANLLKKLRWIRLNQELGKYCINYQTGKSVMLPLIAKKAFPMLVQDNQINNLDQYDAPLLINTNLSRRTNVFEKIQQYGMDLSGKVVSGNKLNDFRRNHFELPYSWNKTGVVTTKISLRYGVWDRDPTNDLNVVRFCLSLPEDQFVKGGMDRAFIRRTTKKSLPDKIRLNMKIRGLQGADTIHRMMPHWNSFISELKELTNDSRVTELLNIDTVKQALTRMGEKPRLEHVFNDDFKLLSRSLIVYRFIKKF
ncbi:asparagine synthase-related protein [Litchfieldia salsa]|uniref:asparagine synthase (glutamine-hydrolyzing) n=1 Tax=Litchfieldia salsa TaxID=930152 RepID=A0A1H0VFG0_9BACI|nr:asparagine synthase-related protein [Litchfieldia salsa]SDP76948.1 asparagine synthase (glutamine-hydrolysing) [Litchfieldia salsa]